MAIKPVSPLNLDRYEIKYLIPMAMVQPISEYVEQFCEMDYYSQISPDNFYVINSLYLDTLSKYVLRKQQNVEHAFSCFRIRSYGANPKLPFYVESKQKIGEFCKKRRGKITFENIEDLFTKPNDIPGFDPYADKNVASFLEKHTTLGLEPKILTQYRRKAYLSTCDDYARITFDRDLRFMEETTYNVVPDESRMSHYDQPDAFAWYGSGANVVLELKAERKIPIWMVELVRRFDLTRGNFSKYKNSMIEMQALNNPMFAFDYLNRNDHRAVSPFPIPRRA
jgi:hypothetical protein